MSPQWPPSRSITKQHAPDSPLFLGTFLHKHGLVSKLPENKYGEWLKSRRKSQYESSGYL